jgi:hypothetical protein
LETELKKVQYSDVWHSDVHSTCRVCMKQFLTSPCSRIQLSLFFIMGSCYVNMLQLLMLIAGYTIYEHVITQQLISAIVIVRSARSLSSRNRCPACVHVTKQPLSSEEWHITVDPWFIVDECCCCVVNHLLDEVVNNLLFELMGKQTLNTLIWIEVIQSIEPTWNMCIVWYFSSFISSNKRCSNETLVCAVIRTSDPSGQCRFPCTLPPIAWVTMRTTMSQGFFLALY